MYKGRDTGGRGRIESPPRIGPQIGPQTGPHGGPAIHDDMAARKAQPTDKIADRYLQKRADGGYRYRRRVPDRFEGLDPRRFVRLSLHTADLAIARLRRAHEGALQAAQEAADDELWAALSAGSEAEAARRRYEAARARAGALGFAYATAAALAATEPVAGLVARIEALAAAAGPGGAPAAKALDVDALLGGVEEPRLTVSAAHDLYLKDIAAGERRAKSPAQYASWRKVKARAAANFIAVVGDKPLDEITRADAQKFWRWWQDRIDGGQVAPNSAARDFGNMRKLYAEAMRWIDRPDAPNPFRNLSFTGGPVNSRPPFAADFIRDRLLAGEALAGLNADARGILLALVETGCRPSEIANLRPASIRLDAPVPHIRIEPGPGLEIKTRSSIREIPLVGVSLAALAAHPEGFPRYYDRATQLSAALQKYLRGKGLLPTARHSVYSLRHSFEDRMKEAGIDYGLRCRLMGHATDRPVYGAGGSLEWQAGELGRIALPFNPAVVG